MEGPVHVYVYGGPCLCLWPPPRKHRCPRKHVWNFLAALYSIPLEVMTYQGAWGSVGWRGLLIGYAGGVARFGGRRVLSELHVLPQSCQLSFQQSQSLHQTQVP